jgi:ribosomal protein S18 acetylase RimI-like enzyme
MPLLFRPARASDADAAVPLIHSAGPAEFDLVFARPRGPTAQDFLRYAFARGSGQFGWQAHTVGELDGAVVAAGTHYTSAETVPYLLSGAQRIVAFYGLAAPDVMQRGIRLERLIPPPPKGVLYLAHLGVAPSQRSTGVGTKLVEVLLQKGRDAGLPLAGLDVAASNPRAQALYERLGFTVQAERTSTLPGMVAHRYMPRPL